MSKAILGIADENLTSDLRTLLDEMQGVEVVASARDTGQLIEFADRFEPDLILLHDALGPEPTVAVIRDLAVRRPAGAVVQVSPERSSTTVIRALEAGARGVVAYPFAFEDFSGRIQDALDWSQQMQRILMGAAAVLQAGRGQVVTLVGAKGGVGVTTMALHLAMDHHANHPNERVCVVDLDIEKGDVSAMLDVRQAVSIADLAKVHQDLSAGTVSDAVIEHESGVFLMLAPVDIRQTEFVTPEALRAIVALLRREFDLVIIDAGGYVSPAQGAAVELADETVVVTTPDVLAVRAMRKRILAWESLGVRHEGELRVLVNKVDKASIFPADAVAKLTTAQVLPTSIPLSTRVIEPAVNERDPQAVTDVNWWKLMSKLRHDLSMGSTMTTARRAVQQASAGDEAPDKPRRRRLLARSAREKGAIALENVGIIPLALFFAVAMYQIAALGVGAIWLGQAATEATRTYSITSHAGLASEAARQTMPSQFASGLSVSASGDQVNVTLKLPPGILLSEISSTHQVTKEPK